MKEFLKKYGNWVAGITAGIAILWLLWYLLRKMEYRFNDVHESTFWKDGKTEAEVGAQSVIPQQFWGKEVLTLNSPSLFKAGDTVTVTYDDGRRGAVQDFKVLHAHGRSAIVIDRAPSPSGGPWSGTVTISQNA